MNIPCSGCGGRFGGQETFNRHFLKREDRCKTPGEMKAAGLVQDIWGVWRRAGSRTTAQASLIDRRTIRRHVTRRPLRDREAGGVPRGLTDTSEAQEASGGRG